MSTWVSLGLCLADDSDKGGVEEEVVRVVPQSPLHEPPHELAAELLDDGPTPLRGEEHAVGRERPVGPPAVLAEGQLQDLVQQLSLIHI